MATLATKNQLISTVVSGFIESTPGKNTLPLTWVQEILFNPQSNQVEVDNFAKGILLDFHFSTPKNDSKRYQFRVLKASDELLKVIFEESFHHASQPVIRDAKCIEGSFYPLWKRVCLIYIPKTLGTFFGSPLIKMAISIAVLYYTYKIGNSAFKGMKHLFKGMEHLFIDKVIPFVINNTPITLIRSSNRILDAIDWVRQRKFKLLIGTFIIQKFILYGPNIPYFTATIRAINIWDIGWALYRSPQTLFGFLISSGVSGAQFSWRNSNFLSAFFSSIAIKAESERLATSKSKSYAAWKKIITENTPKRD